MVGVVLGAVPLIVSALETYKTSKRAWTRFRKTALLIDELIEALAENEALIETSVEFLFQKLDVKDEIVGNDAATYVSKLEILSCMGKLHKPYKQALLRWERTLLEIVNKFEGLVLDSKVEHQTLSHRRINKSQIKLLIDICHSSHESP